MARKNRKGRKVYPKAFGIRQIAKILNVKPSSLTSNGVYVRNRGI